VALHPARRWPATADRRASPAADAEAATTASTHVVPLPRADLPGRALGSRASSRTASVEKGHREVASVESLGEMGCRDVPRRINCAVDQRLQIWVDEILSPSAVTALHL
jgi:hypothetical protein